MSDSSAEASRNAYLIMGMTTAQQVPADEGASQILEIARDKQNGLSPFQRMNHALNAAIAAVEGSEVQKSALEHYTGFVHSSAQTDRTITLEQLHQHRLRVCVDIPLLAVVDKTLEEIGVNELRRKLGKPDLSGPGDFSV